MLQQIVNIVLIFFAFSFIGWCIEVTLKYFEYHRFINRGFLAGPWLPIYGTGAVFITLATDAASRFESGYGTTFAISFILCGTLEYFVSYYMEKRFHAHWWDYSKKPMNLKGRIWIGNLILFGIGGVIIVHLMNPILLAAFSRISLASEEIIASSLSAIIAADFILSHFIMKLVKTGVESSEADNTEEIGREIRLLLSNRSIFHRRFAEAYPEVIYRTEKINARLEEIRIEMEHMRREAEERAARLNKMVEDGRAQLAFRLEPVDSIKNTVIDRQGELIELLYDESTSTAEMRELKHDIDVQKERIKSRPSIRRTVRRITRGGNEETNN